MLSSLKISAQPLSLVTLSVRVHSVGATDDPWKVYLSLLEVQAFPRAFGDESGTSLSIPQILGDTAGSLSVSHGSVPERKILSSSMGPDERASLALCRNADPVCQSVVAV